MAAPCVAAQAPADAPAGDERLQAFGLKAAPLLDERLPADANALPVFMDADRVEGENDTRMTLEGNAQLRRADVILKGDRLQYDPVEDVVEATGNIRLLREGNIISGPRLKLNLSAGTGEIDEPRFFFGLNGGSGAADRIEMLGRNRVRADGVRYSGCDCEMPAWEVRARRIDFDYDKGEATSYGSVLYFKDVPILGSPYMTFPITDARKSGFLSPSFGFTSKGGAELLLPYYVNIAPNRDLTLFPRYISRRGLQAGAEFRYLEPGFSGETRATYLSSDRLSGSDRYLFSSLHRQRLTQSLDFSWNVSKASDDAYFRDFSAVGTGLAATATLERSFRLNWNSGYWSAFGQVVNFQTLQDPLAAIVPPYAREPQVHLTGARYDWNGLDVRFDADATRFKSDNMVSGTRAYAYTSMAYPMLRPGGFVIPKVGLHTTRYNTDAFQGNASFSATRTVPIVSLDTGLVFERDSTLLGQAVTQTLEPRLYYLRVPYRDQSRLPVYDTALADFNFAQIFSENLFVGSDRIADANQLTAALTTRWLDPRTGVERARLMGAQRLYFSDQRVTLPGESPRANGRSDFLVSVYGAVTSTLSGETTVQYNPHISRVSRSTIGARWTPARLSTVAVAYRFKREGVNAPGQEQVDVAFQWPLAPRWYAVGRVDYSLLESRIAETVAGIEYKGACCWAFRVVGQRYAVAKNNATTALFFQLELNGFGGIGPSPLSTLRRSIPGYQSINPPPEAGTVFERYE